MNSYCYSINFLSPTADQLERDEGCGQELAVPYS